MYIAGYFGTCEKYWQEIIYKRHMKIKYVFIYDISMIVLKLHWLFILITFILEILNIQIYH
jgi:hypothetical protein